jgi:hypothetical protein
LKEATARSGDEAQKALPCRRGSPATVWYRRKAVSPDKRRVPLRRTLRTSSAPTKTYGRPRILVTDGLSSGDESILRQLGGLRHGITKAGDLTRWLALACLTEFRIVFRLRGVW